MNTQGKFHLRIVPLLTFVIACTSVRGEDRHFIPDELQEIQLGMQWRDFIVARPNAQKPALFDTTGDLKPDPSTPQEALIEFFPAASEFSHALYTFENGQLAHIGLASKPLQTLAAQGPILSRLIGRVGEPQQATRNRTGPPKANLVWPNGDTLVLAKVPLELSSGTKPEDKMIVINISRKSATSVLLSSIADSEALDAPKRNEIMMRAAASRDGGGTK